MRSEKRGKGNKIIIIAVSFIFVLILVFAIIFNRVTDMQLTISAEEEIESFVIQQQIVIENQNYTNVNSLQLMATAISEGYVEQEDIPKYLSEQKDNIRLVQVYYIDMQGNGISADGEEKDFSDNVACSTAMQSGTIASAINENTTITNGIMDICVPVIMGDEVVGVVLGESNVNSVFELLTETIGDDGYIVIVDAQGEAVVASTEDFFSAEEIASGSVEFSGAETPGMAEENIANQSAGTLHFSVDGVERIARYMPLGFGGLTLVVVMEEENLQEGIRDIADVVTLVSFAILLIFVLVVIYVGFSKMRSVREIEKVAYYDELTKLPNMLKLKKDAKQTLTENTDKKYAIIKCDVMNFKAINDIYGFEVGNKVLCAFKTISDMADEKTLLVARTGVDEFIFFAGNNFIEQLDASTAHYESFFKQLIPELSEHHLVFRYGRYFIEQGDTDIDEIVNRASLAHTIAKSRTDSVIWDYDDGYKAKLLQQTTIVNKMKNALKNGEFFAFLQPKFDIKARKLVGAEALVRWVESDGKIVYPNDFIPVFESNGFIVQIDKYILESVCKTLSKWIAQGVDCVPVSVNFSRVHLDNPSFAAEIKGIVDSYNIPHSLIEIEITETTALQNEKATFDFITDLHAEGFAISIDDFGSGYSSLGFLKDFKVDTIKLDRSFITHTGDEKRGEIVVEGMISLARSLEMHIVAEGIEDEKQLDFLGTINCHSAQGYYFARPMPIAEFEQKYVCEKEREK